MHDTVVLDGELEMEMAVDGEADMEAVVDGEAGVLTEVLVTYQWCEGVAF